MLNAAGKPFISWSALATDPAGTQPDRYGRQRHRYLSNKASELGRVRILSSVVGRQTKADRPEAPCRLEVETGKPFVGGFTIALKPQLPGAAGKRAGDHGAALSKQFGFPVAAALWLAAYAAAPNPAFVLLPGASAEAVAA